VTLVAGALLPVAALAWPLILALLGALPPLRSRALLLLPAAPLPALALALVGTAVPTEIPGLLLGTVLEADRAGRLLLGATAAVWLAAGIYACGYMDPRRKPAVFTGLWCVTLAGNLGVFVAADVATFYVAFAAVSLASYFLVVHDGTEAALRAGRVYLVLAIVGEACLLLAFMIGIAAADSLMIAELRAAMADAPIGVLLLVTGFGIKAGLMPLHVWLPLAHPAAPTPASAALSGAIVKAGIIGLIVFLPPDPPGGHALVTLGFAGAFLGALLGLPETNPKTVLAYSTVSQMSLVVALVAAGSGAAAYYAAHHGLAKGALFLAVGLVPAASARARGPLLLATALAALSVAGLPLTGGALAKSAAKDTLGHAAALALELSAITTTLVLARFLHLLRTAEPAADPHPLPPLAAPTLALAAAALLLPWLLWPAWTDLPLTYPIRPGTVIDGAWPIALALAIFALPLRAAPSLRLDLVGLAEREAEKRAALPPLRFRRPRLTPITRLAPLVAIAEPLLLRWRLTGLALLMLLLSAAALASS
jgi:hydrogenase-4 component B